MNATHAAGHHGCTLVSRQLQELAAEAGITITAWVPLSLPVRQRDWSKFDLVIVNGEGTLHHDRAGAKAIAQLAPFLADVGVPAYLINSVYQGNSPSIAEGLKRFRGIWVRDSRSASEAKNHGLDVTIVPDLTLTWNVEARRGFGKRIVVIDSVDRDETAGLYEVSKHLNASFYSIMSRPPRIETFPDRNFGSRCKYQWRRASAWLRSPPQKARWRAQFPTFETFAAYLSNEAGLIVSGRFHALCLAIVLEVPFLAWPSNTHKMEGLLEDAQLSNRIISDRRSVAAKLGLEGMQSYAFSENELLNMRAYKFNARLGAEGMFKAIASGC
ncbi:polysaccharide pyruvyl transferase family protein [Hyphomicrobium denitrificans]|nr:polysaccharide pyruvyl transferase family protein [Hyphomicrobium denitrificans]